MKRVLAYALAAIVAMNACLCAANAAARTTGDVNGDGRVTAADAARTLRAAYGLETLDASTSALADTTGNMGIGSGDACAILLLASGRIDRFSDIGASTLGGLLGEAFMDKFSYRGVVSDLRNYRSSMVSVSISSDTQGDFVYHVADIYVRSASSVRTAFGGGAYGVGRERVQEMALSNGAIVAINGDGYSAQRLGPLVRNGVWYRDSVDQGTNICALYRNGEMLTYAAGVIDAAGIEAGDPVQTWTGGPQLLDESGKALTSFECDRSLIPHGARTAIGYYQPGHYCFIVVDGRHNPASNGATMDELAQLAEALKCKAAFNLQGGNSSAMSTQTRTINAVNNGGRSVSDTIFICEPTGTGGA